VRRLLQLLPLPLLFILGPLQVSPCGQSGCPNTLVNASEHIDGFLSKSGCVNPIVDDTYLKVGTQYQVDALATVTGYCQRTGFRCPTALTCGCYPDPNEYRGVAAINIRELDVSGAVVFYPNPNTGPATCDTRASGTTTPDSATWTFTVQGVRTLRYKNQVATASACNEGLVSVETDRRFIVTKCIPQFQRDANGNLIHLKPNPNAPYTTLVYIPPTMNTRMRAGIENAIAAWNDALAGSGLPRFQATDVLCGGAYCVKTQQDNIPTNDDCARGVYAADPTTGEVFSATITFPSVSGTWGIPFNTRLAEHELAHLLGLKENTTNCPTTDSLMRPVACNGGSFPTTPQPSDYLPVVQSVYGQTPTLTCPAG
jgi:hypothetical protein